MTKATVVIASRTEQENMILKRKLDLLEGEFKGLRFTGIHPMGLHSTVDHTSAVVILNFTEWTGREAVHLRELNELGYQGKILVIAKAEVTQAVREMKANESVVFLEKPFEHKDLQGIVRKMLTDRAVAQRIHRRFATDQDAEVEIFGRNESLASRVYNLSKGGAYVEFMTLAALRVGDMVRLKLELKDLNRTYSMPAKIVWTSHSNLGGGTGIGVEFIGPGDVQKAILGF